MLPIYHISFGLIFSILIFFILKLNIISFFILFLSTFIFDVDHYFVYIFEKKSFNFISAYKYFEKRKILKLKEKKQHIYIFHTIEFIFIFSIFLIFLISKFKLSIFYLYSFLLGIFFHIFLDLFEARKKERYSLVLFFIKHKKYK
ncbi:MAG: metal-dependent hydrolase [Candidatus Pacearchaeota archaeon]